MGGQEKSLEVGGDMNIYWYISKAKLDMLKEQKPGFLNGISANVSFKLPFVTGSLSGAERPRLVDDLRRVVKSLKSQPDIKSFDDLGPGETPLLVQFQGPALRHVQDEVFWLASYGNHAALLLAGSAGFAIGGAAASGRSLSPSADPVSAIKAAFAQDDPAGGGFGGVGIGLSGRLSYAWQELIRAADEASGPLPKAGGIAFFARSVVADKSQMQRVGKAHLETLVIGTPLYVEQL